MTSRKLWKLLLKGIDNCSNCKAAILLFLVFLLAHSLNNNFNFSIVQGDAVPASQDSSQLVPQRPHRQPGLGHHLRCHGNQTFHFWYGCVQSIVRQRNGFPSWIKENRKVLYCILFLYWMMSRVSSQIVRLSESLDKCRISWHNDNNLDK